MTIKPRKKRGVSPVVSYVLILAILLTITVGSYIWADYMQNRMKSQIAVSEMESQMVGLATIVRNVANGDTNYTITQNIYFQKGVLMVEGEKDWIKYLVQTNGRVYPPATGTEDSIDGCTATSLLIKDNDTLIKMGKYPFTDMYRGATGNDLGQRVEIVACFPDIDITEGQGCIGKSGPLARVKIKKIGYAGTKPMVQVEIC